MHWRCATIVVTISALLSIKMRSLILRRTLSALGCPYIRFARNIHLKTISYHLQQPINMWTLLRIELFKIFKRPRTYIAFAAIAAIVLLIQLAFYVDGETYIQFMLQNINS